MLVSYDFGLLRDGTLYNVLSTPTKNNSTLSKPHTRILEILQITLSSGNEILKPELDIAVQVEQSNCIVVDTSESDEVKRT